MSNIYDKSSLVLIPSGTKTGKVYSQKPVSGDGDFTFTRSSAATRVNASGNIEKETQNLFLQSNQFDTTWSLVNTSVASGQLGYDGSSDAWLFTALATSNCQVRQTISGSGVQSISIYAKANTSNFLGINAIVGSTNAIAYFDLSSGAVGTINSAVIDANIESVGGGWYRCSLVYSDTNTQMRFFLSDADGSASVTNGNSIYIQNAQLEQGLVARDYIETTTTAVEGGITDNVPRLDYTDSSCPALLLEPQRTNLLPNSEYIGSSDWDKNGFGTGVAPILTFGEESPEGLNNAYEITFNTGAGTSSGNQSNISEGIGGQAAGDYTLSFWAKVSSGTDKIIARGAGGYLYTTCNLTTEWQRFEITENLATAGTLYADIGLRRGLANEPLNSSVTCQIYGIQMEAGSYATSYIPTYGSSVTRVVEATEKTGISDLIGQTEGTLFVEFEYNSTKDHYWPIVTLMGSSTAELIEIYGGPNSNSMALVMIDNGSNQFSVNTPLSFGAHKVAIAYAENNTAAYVDGVLLGSVDTSCTIPALTQMAIGKFSYTSSYAYGDSIKQTLLFKTRLSNEELAALTTI